MILLGNTFASFYTNIVDGLSIRARDVALRKTLTAIVDCAMAAWDKLAGKTGPDAVA